ncbi:MAG: phosphoenolpyruvate synthase [Patescibacteria group bacterium]|jgi:pyruvate,water dikinase|nr:phosphoenolpyruvate synthase [Candidatus Magasanikbacteria bacterium]
MGLEKNKRLILWLKEISLKDISLVGEKNAFLGDMYANLIKEGINIPKSFSITAEAYGEFLRFAKLKDKLKKYLKNLDVSDVRALAKVGKKIRDLIMRASLPEHLEKEIILAYEELVKQSGTKNLSVAVRSSITTKNLSDASFVGQQETYLNVVGKNDLLLAVKKCFASLFTDRAIFYRETKDFDHFEVALSVTVQQMVRSDVSASGVMFTFDTESGFEGVVLIKAIYGLGEYITKGKVIPDQFYVFKEGVKQGKKAIIGHTIGSKDVKLVYGAKNGTKQVSVKQADRDKFAITDDEVIQLSKWGMKIEEYYKKPQDIEWAKDGKTGKLYILQIRPKISKIHTNQTMIEKYNLKKKSKILLSGISVGQKIGAGKVRIIDNLKQMKNFKKGEILVAKITDSDWEPIMRIAGAIVVEQGDKTSHTAIVSRELGIPCIVGAKGARKILKNGQKVTVSCIENNEGNIYTGILPFEVNKIKLKQVAKTKTKIMMNIGDPDNAFALSFLPNDGVGLANEEFIFSNFIRIHPLALLNYSKLKDKVAKKKIAEITKGYKNKTDYFIDKLAEGIGRIAAAFYKNEVIVRLSDFKTNEYANLIGGKEFEPKEENPLLGWRGASRYFSKEYKQAFKLECEALKRVRDEWGLTNVIIMVPFCRTPEEGEQVIKTMAEFGLKQGENGLKIYVMCEIPSNVILAEDFCKIFDGFSIGSNDLTQLTLGVDRDSNLVSQVYSEKNKAVINLIKQVIKTAHKYKRKVSICGQAPSDYPEFAEMLVREGIDSISLNPDKVISTRERIANVEKTLGKSGKKTNFKFLSLIIALGIMGMSILSLGAGCTYQEQERSYSTTNTEMTPAQFREKVEQKENNKLVEFIENNFANFSISYPAGWTIENWNRGVTMKNKETNEYISVFSQAVGHPVLDSTKEQIVVDGRKAYKFKENYQGGEENYFYVVEIDDKEQTIEINSNYDDFDSILNSFSFVNKKDKGEICIQMIVYARQNNLSECQMFPTPCDVPDDWQVCEK